MNPRVLKSRQASFALALVAGFLPLAAQAAPVTWDAGTNAVWTGPSDTTSWTGATYNDGDDASFLGAGTGTVTMIGIVNPASVTVNSAAAADYTFNGVGIGGAATLTKTGASRLYLNTANTYTGVTTITGGQIRISHADALGTTAGETIIQNGTKLEPVGNLTIAEPITNQGGGNGKIQSVSGTQTFTAPITLEAGMDIRGSDYVFQGGFTSANNSAPGFNGARYIVETTPITIGSGVFGLTSAGNNPANASQLNVGGNVWNRMRINFGGYLTLGVANALPAAAGVEFGWNTDGQSSGSLDLNGFDQTIAFLRQTANFPATNGDQNVTGGGTLTIDTAAGTFDYHGRITDGASATSIVKNGTGTQILNNQSGTASNYSGSLTINAGIVESQSGSDFSDFGSIVLAGGTVNLNYTGTDQIAALDLGSGFVANGVYSSADSAFITGTGTLTVAPAPAPRTWDGSTNLTWTGPSDNTSWSGDIYNDGDFASFGDTGAGTVTISGAVAPGSLTVNSTSAYTFSGDAISGTTGLSKSGTGDLTLTDANSYSGATTIDEGTLQLGNGGAGGALSTTSVISIASGATFAFDQSDTVTQGVDFSDTLSGAGNLTQNGSGALGVKLGTTHSGATTINGGTLQFTNTADLKGTNSPTFAINNGSTLEFQSSVGGANRTVLNGKTFTFDAGGGGTINFNGGNHLFQGGGNTHNFVTTGGSQNTISTTSGGFMNMQGAGTVTFTVADGPDAVDLNFSGTWNNGLVTKNGAGTMAFTGGYNGSYPITINGGTLEVGGSAILAGGTFTQTITNDSILSYNSTGTQTISGAISGTGALVKDNTGPLTLTAANTYTGTTTVSGGTLQIGDGGTTGSLAVASAITNNGILCFNRSNTVTQGVDFSGAAITGTGTFEVKGGGTVVLNNNATFDDGASVSVATGSTLNLAFSGTDTIDELFLGGIPRASGTWGATGSGATNINDIYFSGAGTLTVTTDPPPYATELATVAALGTDAAMLTAPAIFTDDTTPGTAATLAAGDEKVIYFDALDYQGNPTRVYAWVGIPAGATAGNPAPGMVLVHGGGGSASQSWVQKWTERGYAAISISVEGQKASNGDFHAMPGPSRGALYNDSPSSLADEWMYHAVADCVLANSLLRSLPEVDATKIGLTGYSWGGVITSTVIGIDTRLMFAIPTYGCGHKYDSRNYYGANLANNESYKNVWDPMIRIANATMPVLWLSWPEEPHFLMDSLAYTYHGAPGTRMVSLRPGMGHGGNFNSPEYYDYADDMVSGTGPWCVQQSIDLTGNTATVVFNSTKTLNTASLVYRTGNQPIITGVAQESPNPWTEIAADSLVESPAGTWTVTATLPAGATGWFVNTKATGSDTGDLYGYVDSELIASSDYEEIITLSANNLSMEHPLVENQSTDTVDLSYTGPANVEISSITISGESHAGAFSSLTSAPLVILNPTPVTAPLTIQFDNTVASLTDGQTATADLTIVWDELDGSIDQITVSLSATAQAAATVVYDTSADWDSQTVNSVDNVIIRNDATVTVGEAVAPDLIVNGSFETPDAADGSFTINNTAGPLDANWTIVAGGVTVVDSWDTGQGAEPNTSFPSEGEQFLQLQGTVATAGTISQTFTTTPGSNYELTFDYSALSFDSRALTITYDIGGADQTVNLTSAAGQIPWASETFEFTATAATTTLTFTGQQFSGFWGPAIDNVRVTAAPATAATADTIIVNDDASPLTATLDINQDYSLTATTSMVLGAGTGAGFVNQSTGTVTTADLTINSSGTGDLSQYNLSGGELSVSNAIIINANGEFNQTGGTISGSGTITNNGLFTYNSTTDQTLSGVISGTGTVTKDGAGTLTLSASNTFTGGTTVNAGLLDLVGQERLDGALTVDGSGIVKLSGTSHNAFGGISSVTLQNGGTFTDNSQGGYVQSVSAPVTFDNGGTMTSEAGANGLGGFGNFLFINGINVTGTGLATISASGISFNFGQTITVADTVAGSGTDLLISSIIKNERVGTNVKAGAGTLTLTGINTDTSPWSITGGTLEIGGAGQLQSGSYAGTITNDATFEYNSTANQTLSGAISGSGALVKDNTGTLTLSATNSYTGATTVNAGTLSLGNGTANTALDDAADLSVATGAVVDLNFSGTDTIDELFLSGLQMASGTWGATGSGATNIDDTYFTGAGTLTIVGGGPPYDTWAYGYLLKDTNGLEVTDVEGDTLVNLLEFAFGTNPNVSDNAHLTVTDGTTFTAGTPTTKIDWTSGLNFTARFVRLFDHAAAGLTYTAEFSNDLAFWEASAETPTVVSDASGDYQVVEIPYTFFLSNGRKAQYFRVKVNLSDSPIVDP